MAHYRGSTNPSFLAEQNQKQEESLAEKVKSLKSISINIGEEVRYQNKMLSDMTDDSNSVFSMLTGSMSRLKKIAKSSSMCKSWVQIGVFGFCVVIAMYFILRLS